MRGRIHVRGFWRDQRGASAVEFALVAPLLIGLLLGIIQYGSLFLLQTRMNDAARDTARRLAVGDLATETEAEEYAVSRLADWSATFTAAAELIDVDGRKLLFTVEARNAREQIGEGTLRRTIVRRGRLG